MNMEYLGPSIKKGSFAPKNVKIGYFVIDKVTTEEIYRFMSEVLLPTTPSRTYDPNELVKNALK